MNKDSEVDIRWEKVAHVYQKYTVAADKDESLEASCEALCAGRTPQSLRYLTDIGFYKKTASDRRIQANISFYLAAGASVVALFCVVFIVFKYEGIATGVLSAMGALLSSLIARTFLRIHRISLDELNRFLFPRLRDSAPQYEDSLTSFCL